MARDLNLKLKYKMFNALNLWLNMRFNFISRECQMYQAGLLDLDLFAVEAIMKGM